MVSIPYLLDVDLLSKQDIFALLDSADAFFNTMQRGKNVPPLLSGKTVATVFFEESTRTRLSFARATRMLGGETLDLPIPFASVKKGESLRNTLRSVQNLGADAVVMRHPESGTPYFATKNLSIPIVNAGDGTHAHPTQALVDLLTIRRRIGSLKDLKVAIIGDILSSRVAASDIIALRKLNARITVFGPQPLLPRGWRWGVPVTDDGIFHGVNVAANLREALSDTHVVIVLRMQKERYASDASLEGAYVSLCHISKSKFEAWASPETIIMHAGPMNESMEISTSLARSPRCTVEEQVRYGIAVRMAVLSAVCTETKRDYAA